MAKPKQQEDFRDRIGTVDEKGDRIWVYPKKPTGKFYNFRTYLSWILLIVLFGMPFIKINGDPLLLFNVIERKFILFSIVFTPQDLHLFALAMITLIVFIVLFTVVFGRLFCGWVCPQTIFMEMIFRKIEYWIEGDSVKQKRLNESQWNFEKIWKKTLKLSIFYAISVLIANTFLSYIIGVDQVIKIIKEPISMHLSGFIAMIIFSGVFFFVFSWLREQVCTTICPYGRLQGVLLTNESVVVAYDYNRGEPRGRIKKKREGEDQPALGDCIDCFECVKVCPTAIDIRNGTQMECINCTACIDACDKIMDQVNRPKGLIRYDSMSNLEENKSKIFTPRVYAYSVILLILLAVQVVLFSIRTDVETVILRTPGMLFQETENNRISNLYNFQIINKTSIEIEDLSFKLKNTDGDINVIGKVQNVGKQKISEGSFFVEIDKNLLNEGKNKIIVEVYADDKLIDQVETNFLGPINIE